MISERHNINREELAVIWDTVNKSRKRVRKVSGYNLFCKEVRPMIKEQYPDLTPPQVMKKLGEMWTLVDESSKEGWLQKAAHYKPDPNDITEMSIKQLKEKCKENGLKISGSKKQLIERLQNPTNPEHIKRKKNSSTIKYLKNETKQIIKNRAEETEDEETDDAVFDAETEDAVFDAETEDEVVEEDDYTTMKKSQLVELCRKKGYRTNGNKSDLIERLMDESDNES